MIMRILLSFLLLLTGIQWAMAQEKLPALGIMPLDAPELSEEKAIKINKFIEAAFYHVNRFNIVTRQLQESISQEREQQKYDIDNIVIEQGKAIGADYIVKGFAKKYKKQVYKSSPKSRQGTPTKSSTAKQEDSPPPSAVVDQVFTSTLISFSIKILNVKTGVILAEKTYNGSINNINYFIRGFVRSTFPQSFRIVEVMEIKGKKKARQLLVDGGFKHGLSKSTYLNVYEISEEMVDGKAFTREIEVGKLYVKRLDTGGNFSLCTVYQGKEEILKKVNQGIDLICKPPKSFRLFGMDFEYVY